MLRLRVATALLVVAACGSSGPAEIRTAADDPVRSAVVLVDFPRHDPAPSTSTTAPTTTTTAPVPPPAPTTTTVAPPPTSPPVAAVAPSGDGDPNDMASWDRLAGCESGGDWSINTGNGYYGGIQFALGSWRSVGGQGMPHEASRDEQIRRGQMLWASGGWAHWPACTRSFGWR